MTCNRECNVWSERLGRWLEASTALSMMRSAWVGKLLNRRVRMDGHTARHMYVHTRHVMSDK
jgi:hypothetical protein